MTRHINDLIATRRALLGGLAGLPLLNLAACASTSTAPRGAIGFARVPATNADTVTVPAGYSWRSLIAWGDALFDTVSPSFDPDALTRAEQEQRFGQNNDMVALFAADYAFPPPRDPDRLILCANNEYAIPSLMFPGLARLEDFTAAHAEAIYASMGVSVVALARANGEWQAQRSPAPGQGVNRRITPFTPVRFTGPAANHRWIGAAAAIVNTSEPGAGAGEVACGTLQNCAGGLTPWGTYLTAEENFQDAFAGPPNTEALARDAAYARDAEIHTYPDRFAPDERAPRQFHLQANPYGPSLYGWIVEIDPYDPNSTPKKRTALGRKKNECATTAIAADGRVAVYMGDDERNEHVYKFVTRGRFNPADRAANMDLLDDGDLYVAQLFEDGGGRWLHLTVEAANAAALQAGADERFSDLGDLVMRVREAARLLGATPMDRPEDVEALCDEHGRGLGPVLIACTNNSNRSPERPGNPHRHSGAPEATQRNRTGHILRFDEAGGDVGALTFTWDIFAVAGDPGAEGFTAPMRNGDPAHVSVAYNGAPSISGDRFACPDNLFIDASRRVWIATDGNDNVFADCNDAVLVAPAEAAGPRPVRRFLVGPLGAEICGPLLTPDERAFLCAIQHPGANNAAGDEFSETRWTDAPPPSHFPDGGASWPRSAIVIVTRDDGGRIGD